MNNKMRRIVSLIVVALVVFGAIPGELLVGGKMLGNTRQSSKEVEVRVGADYEGNGGESEIVTFEYNSLAKRYNGDIELPQGISEIPHIWLNIDGEMQNMVEYRTENLPYTVDIEMHYRNDEGMPSGEVSGEYTLRIYPEGYDYDNNYVEVKVEDIVLEKDRVIMEVGETHYPKVIDIKPGNASSKIYKVERDSPGEILKLAPNGGILAAATAKGLPTNARVRVCATDSTEEFGDVACTYIPVTVIEPGYEYIETEKIEITRDSQVVEDIIQLETYGESVQLGYKATPEDSYSNINNELNLSWSSSDPNVVNVDTETGLVKILNAGIADITLTSITSKKSDTIRVEVRDAVLENVKVTNVDTDGILRLKLQDQIQLGVETDPKNIGDVVYKWIIDSVDEIVNISHPSGRLGETELGVMTATGVGQGSITFLADHKGNKIAHTFKVIVEDETIDINKIEITNVAQGSDGRKTKNLIVGEKFNPEYRIEPENAHIVTSEWVNVGESKSIHVNILTGEVEALQEGKGTVRVRTRSNNSDIKEDEFDVVVSKEVIYATGVDIVDYNVPSEIKVGVDGLKEITLEVGKEKHLYTALKPDNANNGEVEWYIEGNTGVIVIENGKITSRKVGEVTVVAKVISSEGKLVEDKIRVTVVDNVSHNIKFNESVVNMVGGESKELIYKLSSENIDKTSIQWGTSDHNIVSLTSDRYGGVVLKANREGTALITAELANGYRDSVMVKVTDKGSGVNPETGGYVGLNNIIPTERYVELLLEESLRLGYKLEPENATDRLVYFESSNSEIVNVGDDGTVTGVTPGKATIIAHNGLGVRTEYFIEVLDRYKYVYVREVDITKDGELELMVGETEQLTATVKPASSNNAKIIWTSSDKSVVVVEDGKITATGKGTATVKALAYGTKAYDEIKVIVKEYTKEATSIEVEESNLSMKVGEYKRIKAKLLPDDTTQSKVKFIYNSKHISIDRNGGVMALSPGNVEVTIATPDSEITTKVNIDIAYGDSHWVEAGKSQNLSERKDFIVRFSMPIDIKSLEGNIFMSKDSMGNGEKMGVKVTLSEDKKSVIIKNTDIQLGNDKETDKETGKVRHWDNETKYYLFVAPGIKTIDGVLLGRSVYYELETR